MFHLHAFMPDLDVPKFHNTKISLNSIFVNIPFKQIQGFSTYNVSWDKNKNESQNYFHQWIQDVNSYHITIHTLALNN